jgi:hypothetical protein
VDTEFIISEGKWWVYPFYAILIADLIFFIVLFWKRLRLVLGTPSVSEISNLTGSSKSRITTLVSFSLGWQLMLAVLPILVLWFVYQDTFAGFTTARFGTTQVVLEYMWPRPRREIPRSEVEEVISKEFAKGARILEITTSEGRKFRSVSGDADEIKRVCDDFRRELKLKTR